MRILKLIFALFITISSLAQEPHQHISFLRDNILGDSINTSTMPRSPIKIDTVELYHHLNYQSYHPLDIAWSDTIIKFQDTASALTKMRIVKQVQLNNEVKWKNINELYHYQEPGKFEGRFNYSLPIFYESGKLIIYRSWYYKSNYSGEEIQFWQMINGEWRMIKSETIWMS